MASAERRMPRRDGEVFRLGTAISVSSRDWCSSGLRPRRDGSAPAIRGELNADQGRAYRGRLAVKLGFWDGKYDWKKARDQRFSRQQVKSEEACPLAT